MTVTQDQFGGINGNTLWASSRIRNKWDYNVAGRFGIAVDRALIYGKAGWVFGGFDWSFATVDGDFHNQGSATLDGLLIGVGLEYAFTNNWTAKLNTIIWVLMPKTSASQITARHVSLLRRLSLRA